MVVLRVVFGLLVVVDGGGGLTKTFVMLPRGVSTRILNDLKPEPVELLQSAVLVVRMVSGDCVFMTAEDLGGMKVDCENCGIGVEDGVIWNVEKDDWGAVGPVVWKVRIVWRVVSGRNVEYVDGVDSSGLIVEKVD